MSKIQLTFQDENIINSIDLDNNLLPLNSSKRIADFRNNAFFGLTGLSFFPSPSCLLRKLFSQLQGGWEAGEMGEGPDARTPPSDALYH